MAGPLLIVDAPSLLYRAFYALPKSITDGKGQSVNALLGTTNLLLREVEKHDPRAVVLCFGPDAAEYRVELFAPYHAERPPVPDQLAPQFAVAPGFFEDFGWTSAISEDLEADDVMGSLAKLEEKAGGEALLMTGDRDLFQCVTDHVKVLYVSTGKRGAHLVDVAEVKRRYGIGPELVPDFIALRGDPSDGIPGAKGVGRRRPPSCCGGAAPSRLRSRTPCGSDPRGCRALFSTRRTSCACSRTSRRFARRR